MYAPARFNAVQAILATFLLTHLRNLVQFNESGTSSSLKALAVYGRPEFFYLLRDTERRPNLWH